jgi:hypothetical protein
VGFFTPGQWLDLLTAVVLFVYSAAVALVPALGPLATAWATSEAAGLVAAAAFGRFALSVRASKPEQAIL